MTSPSARIDQSYRGLLRVPQLSRVLASMMLARVGNAMVGVAIVLFTLEAYDSPALAGLVTLAYILPGILVSPIAGALLDRHGRVRLIILDYIVSGSTLGIIALLALADHLPAGLLVVIAALASLTSILSATGLRSLFPIMVPKQLWERVNAVDSNGYIVATILGPPIAAALVTVVGGPQTLAIIGGLMLLATIPLIGVRDPAAPKPAEAPLLREAWDGVLYVWHNPTLRGLAFSISTLNIAGGVASIAIPLLVLSSSASARRWSASHSPCRASPGWSRRPSSDGSTPAAASGGCSWSPWPSRSPPSPCCCRSRPRRRPAPRAASSRSPGSCWSSPRRRSSAS